MISFFLSAGKAVVDEMGGQRKTERKKKKVQKKTRDV
jgi:hypothetical protein